MVARATNPTPVNQQETDLWQQTWGDPALQRLGRWLTQHDVPEDRAALAVDRIWIFYSYFVMPELRQRVPVPIVAQSTTPPAVEITLPLTDRAPEQELQAAFTREVASPLTPDLDMHLSFAPSDGHRLVAFERSRRSDKRSGTVIIGNFEDRIEDELRTVMAPEDVDPWLDTPNTLFHGSRPRQFLDDPTDRRLRDLILAAKHGLPA